jgi:hypothetical protein
MFLCVYKESTNLAVADIAPSLDDHAKKGRTGAGGLHTVDGTTKELHLRGVWSGGGNRCVQQYITIQGGGWAWLIYQVAHLLGG